MSQMLAILALKTPFRTNLIQITLSNNLFGTLSLNFQSQLPQSCPLLACLFVYRFVFLFVCEVDYC